MMRKFSKSRWVVFNGEKYLTADDRWTADISKAQRYDAEIGLIKSLYFGAVALSAPPAKAKAAAA